MTVQPTQPARLSPVQSADVGPPRGLYERVVRVVSFVFILSALIVVTVADGALEQPLLYVLLASGALVIVLTQDVLPMDLLGRWRFALEAIAVIAFVTLLIALTGGVHSPFFFGYLLLLAGAALWAQGLAPLVLALLSTAAYIAAVVLTAGQLPADGWARVTFNIVALGLVSYVAAVIGREQRRASEAALALSRFDALTGLYNRRHFEPALEQEILRAGRSGRPFSLLLFDLDALKSVNDRFGHEAGDRLLRSIGEIIGQGIRGSDQAARLGGDEFVVILPETDLGGALRVAEKLRRDIGQLSLPHDGQPVHTSVSVGVVSFPDDGVTARELMRRVDRAMYEAKRRGKDQIVHYPPPDHPSRRHTPAAPLSTEWASPSEPDPAAVTDAPAAVGAAGPAAGVPMMVVAPPSDVEPAPVAAEPPAEAAPDPVPRAASTSTTEGAAPAATATSGAAQPGEPDTVVITGEAPWEERSD